ncbi:MAG: 5-formyltetrahydrofolate cyclo-ligase [Oscillospiraceae bacterium]|nr:5-formyltetrahydrofolate cyclo-ligase [Oscillospiraceae bacterium]
MKSKSELRRELISKRHGINGNYRKDCDLKISENIINSPYFERCRQVLLFSSLGDEFDTRYIVNECRARGKRVYYPKCIDRNGHMVFLRVRDGGDLERGLFGISEPKAECEKYAPNPYDIAIIPALAVDEEFNRIGYGKGYYDRFLLKFNGMSVCPCYEELSVSKLPTDKYDVKVDAVATQNELKVRR